MESYGGNKIMSGLSKIYGTPAAFVNDLGGRSGMGCETNNLGTFLNFSLSGEIDEVIGGREYVLELRSGWEGRLLRLDVFCELEGGTLALRKNGVTVATVLGVQGQQEFVDVGVTIEVGDKLTLIPSPDAMPAERWAFSLALQARMRRRVA
jgi:hypothetical protein